MLIAIDDFSTFFEIACLSLSLLAFSSELLFLIYNLVYDPRFSTILIPAFLYVSASLNLSEICKIFSSSRDKSRALASSLLLRL